MSNENPPAFPALKELRTEEGRTVIYHATSIGGMSLRDYFAAHAPVMPQSFPKLPGKYVTEIISDKPGYRQLNERWKESEDDIQHSIRWRWHYADAMLATRTAKPDRP